MIKKAPKNILPRIKTLVLHALFRDYVLQEIGIKHGCIPQIIDALATYGDKTSDETLENGVFVDDTTITDFLLKCRSPTLDNAALYERFLINKGYIHEGRLNELSHYWEELYRNFEVSHTEKTLEDMCINEGIYFHEGNAYNQTVFSSFIVIVDEKNHEIRIWLSEKVYEQRENEDGYTYQERMNAGEFDFSKEHFGYPFLNRKIKLFCMEDNSRKHIRGTLSNDNSENNLTYESIFERDQIVRPHVFLTKIYEKQKQVTAQQPELTKRQRSNITMKNKKLMGNAEGIPHLKNSPSSSDKGTEQCNEIINLNAKLLDAASQSNAVDMVLAIAGGADINAQDPETGWTARHWVAKNCDPIGACVLTGQDTELVNALDVLKAIYESLEKEGAHNVSQIDLKLRQSQKNLDHLIVTNDYQFASEVSPVPADIREATSDPIFKKGLVVESDLFWLEHDALRAEKLPILHQAPLEFRIEKLGTQPNTEKLDGLVL